MPIVDPKDIYLIIAEIVHLLGFLTAFVISALIKKNIKKVDTKGWSIIIVALASGVLHSLFDILDTLNWDNDIISDWLNVADGTCLIICLFLLGIGIVIICRRSLKVWGITNG